jgi:hypothetical protein
MAASISKGRVRRFGVALGACFAVGILTFSVVSRAAGPDGTMSDNLEDTRQEYGPLVDHPLIEGEVVTAIEAVESLPDCADCPRLADSGAGSIDDVAEAYVDGNSGIGFVLKDGTWVTFTPDPRTNAEYVKDWPGDALPPGFAFIELGGLRALAAPGDESNPASISWADGGYLWIFIGYGGSSLDALKATATSMLEA